jgi:hypothetical protein
MNVGNISSVSQYSFHSPEGIHPYCNFVLFQEKSICEEGSQISDDSLRLKIPEHDSWQNDELNVMDSHPGDDQTVAANHLDIYCELEKCRELLRVQYNLNSMYKKEVKVNCFSIETLLQGIQKVITHWLASSHILSDLYMIVCISFYFVM